MLSIWYFVQKFIPMVNVDGMGLLVYSSPQDIVTNQRNNFGVILMTY
jgi:hypothetical protein